LCAFASLRVLASCARLPGADSARGAGRVAARGAAALRARAGRLLRRPAEPARTRRRPGLVAVHRASAPDSVHPGPDANRRAEAVRLLPANAGKTTGPDPRAAARRHL